MSFAAGLAPVTDSLGLRGMPDEAGFSNEKLPGGLALGFVVGAAADEVNGSAFSSFSRSARALAGWRGSGSGPDGEVEREVVSRMDAWEAGREGARNGEDMLDDEGRELAGGGELTGAGQEEGGELVNLEEGAYMRLREGTHEGSQRAVADEGGQGRVEVLVLTGTSC